MGLELKSKINCLVKPLNFAVDYKTKFSTFYQNLAKNLSKNIFCPIFCVGFGQIAHLATTYGAVIAPCIIGTPESTEKCNLDALLVCWHFNLASVLCWYRLFF